VSLDPVLERVRRLDDGKGGGAWQIKGGTYLKHLDVCPRCEDDAVDTKDAEEDVVRGDGVELTTGSPKVERPSSSPS